MFSLLVCRGLGLYMVRSRAAHKPEETYRSKDREFGIWCSRDTDTSVVGDEDKNGV